MRRVLAAVVLVMLLAPEASAQMAAGRAVRTVPMPPEIAAQATFDTSYLLALYMAQLATSGSPPSQAEIDEAARQYFTNGAAVASVPTSGPAAAYFRNGAEVMAYSAPPVAPAVAVTVEPGVVRSESYEEDAGVPRAAASAEEGAPAVPTSTPEVQVGTSTAAGLTCAPREIEAAMAFAGQFASAATPPPAATQCPPNASTPIRSRAEPAAALAAEPPLRCPAGPSLLSRFALALGGVLFGGLAVALWSRPRPVRGTRARNAR